MRKRDSSFESGFRQMLWLTVAGIVAVLGVAFYMNTTNSAAGPTGMVNVFVPSADTKIYVDLVPRTTTREDLAQTVLRDLSPGTHDILVAKKGHWPWEKQVTVRAGETVYLTAWSVPQEPLIRLIPEYQVNDAGEITNENHESIRTLFASPAATATSQASPIEIRRTEDNILALWNGDPAAIPGDFCLGDTCESSFNVLPSGRQIRNIGFLPGNDRVVVFASDTGVYALEIDRNPIQNFQIIYAGKTPDFITGPDDTLYVLDDGVLMQLSVR